jgi:hypothetical protein
LKKFENYKYKIGNKRKKLKKINEIKYKKEKENYLSLKYIFN